MASRILIVKLSSMGDVVHTLPAALALRARFPQAHLGWVVERAHADLLAGQPFLDSLHVWKGRTARSLWNLVRELRATPWDLAIDFQGLLRSALITRFSGARRRVGYVPAKELAHLLYTERIPRGTMDQHAVERSLQLAEAVGATRLEPFIARPYLSGEAGAASHGRDWFPLALGSAERESVDRWLADHDYDATRNRLVILNPHCRKDANRWPASHFAELAARLIEHDDVRVALSGAGSTSGLCDEIAFGLPSDRLWRADGKFSLLGATELFARARVIVTGDTGPMHLAVAVETPVVALFGPASSLRTGPYAADAIVLDRHLECAPCFADKACPLGFDPPRCLAEITVEEAYRGVWQQLDKRRDAAHTNGVPAPSRAVSLREKLAVPSRVVEESR